MPIYRNVSSLKSGWLAGCGLLSLLVLLSCASAGFSQTTYYVAAAGNDANSGRSADAPFQTLAKLSSLSLQPGDAILLKRGDTFRGTLFIRQSGSSDRPIVVDGYGSGNKPIIAGSVPVSNWNNVGNNTWQASCPSCGDRVTGLYRNGATLPLSRYPNLSDGSKGYLTVQSHNGNSQITSQQGFPANWTGGEVVFRPRQWIINRALITQQNGNTLTFSNNNLYGITDGYGFFIQNHSAALDQTGEWYYNPANKTIQLYDNQNDPNGQFITATAFGEGVNLTNASFVTVRNIQITQTLTAGLSANGGSNLVISNNDITRSGFDGVSISGSGNNVLAENNLIEDANNNGFYIQPYQDFTFRGNTIRRAGVVPGRGQSGDGGYSGLQATCRANTVVENNTIDNVGYNGISFLNSATIRNNQVSSFCQTKSDGAGIYTWNGNRNNVSGIRILSNIVYNGIGAVEGTPGGAYSGANGIFLDDCSQNAEVTNNTTFGSRGKGIFLRGATNIAIRGNTSFNNGEQQLMLAYNNTCDLRNNAVQSNILVSRLANQVVAAYESNANDLNQYGPFDYNYYVRPFEDQFKIRAVYNPGSGLTGSDNTLAEWQSRWGQDRNSFNSPITYKTQAVTQTGTSVLNHSFSDNTQGWSGYSPYGNGRVEQDNANRLDGGSLRLSFASASNQGNSYLLATVNIGSVNKGKTYQLLFDGVASSAGKRVQIYPRQLSAGYQDLAARAAYVMGTGRQAYEATFTATADESNAILVIQVQEDGQTAWFDNIRLREATLTTLNPDDYIKLVYNPTGQDKSETLDGVYRDVKNNVYNRQVTVPAFSSVVLLKETNQTAPPTPTPTPTTLRDPENPANAVAGLDYQYYEGNWSNLPDFNALTPAKTGTVANPNLSVRNRDDNFAVRYRGYVSVPTDGVYTFYTNSDDGSKLFIGSTEVVNNDGGHAEQERSGSIGLKAGVHALTIGYFEGGGGQALTVSYAGPNLSKQVIPDQAYRRVSTGQPPTTPPTTTLRDPENPANIVGGLDYQYYEGSWNAVPDFNALTPAETGTIATPNLSVRNRTNNFAIRYRGYVSVPTDGTYTFYTSSDDGSKLFIGSTEVVNNDGPHPEQERSGTIGLKAGVHALTIGYLQKDGGQALTVSYAGPGLGKQVIAEGSYRRVSVGGGPNGGTGTGLRAEYFNNRDLNPPVVLSRIDATVDFDWGGSSPAPGTINADNFSARWTGQVEAPVTGNYIFSTTTDDGLRLWVNGRIMIDNWGPHASTTDNSSPIALTAGQRYDIKMEFIEWSGGAIAKLLWSYPNQGTQIIPRVRLYPAGGGGRLAAAESYINRPEFRIVYPIPTYDEFTFKANDDIQSIRVVDLLGRDHLQFKDIRRGQLFLFGGQLPTGQYLLHVQYTDGNYRVEKLLKASQ